MSGAEVVAVLNPVFRAGCKEHVMAHQPAADGKVLATVAVRRVPAGRQRFQLAQLVIDVAVHLVVRRVKVENRVADGLEITQRFAGGEGGTKEQDMAPTGC